MLIFGHNGGREHFKKTVWGKLRNLIVYLGKNIHGKGLSLCHNNLTNFSKSLSNKSQAMSLEDLRAFAVEMLINASI